MFAEKAAKAKQKFKMSKKTLRIALIGSRELEKDSKYFADLPLCYRVCYRMAVLGVTFTSGLCYKGMDAVAQRAYSQALKEGKVTADQFEVYVTCEDAIKKSRLPNKHLAIIRNPNTIDQTIEMASKVHGAWHNCSPDAKALHSRNCHQIFGYELNNPVDAVITWCPLVNGRPTGGTAVAMRLAENAGIPVFNLWNPNKKETLNQIKDFLVSRDVQGIKQNNYGE